MEVLIRDVKKRELKQVANLYADIYNKFFPNENWSYAAALEYMKYNYKAINKFFYVTTVNKKIIGFALGYVKPWGNGNYLCLEEIVVDKEYGDFEIQKSMLRKMLLNAQEKFGALFATGLTFGTEEQGPYCKYEKIGFKKDNDYFQVRGNVQDILENLNN